MIRTLLLASAGLLLTPTAQADTFHLGTAADAKRVQNDEELGLESQGRTVEGVLLAEEDGYYKVRVVGGTTYLRKDDVHKIEKDGLTVAKIEEMEQQSAEDADEANRERRQLLAAERNLRMERRARAAEARTMDAPMGGQPMEAGFDPATVVAPTPTAFNPVIGVAEPVDATVIPLQLALKLQYEQMPTSRNARIMRLARRVR